MDMSMVTMHLKDPLILFGSEGSASNLLSFSSFTYNYYALSLFFSNGEADVLLVRIFFL